MKFLIDAQRSPALAGWLAKKGHAADHVATLGMMTASDRSIAAMAETNGYVLVSKDEDFLLLRLPDRFGFLWLRSGNATNRALATWLEPRLPEIERLLTSGERLVEVR